MSTSKILRGTFILTMGTMLSRALGLLYIIPFYNLVKEDGGALYTYAYILYSVALSISTLGLPLAVSKFVAKYNALEEYKVGRKLFSSGLIIMGAMGVISFLGLFLLAPQLAPLIIKDVEDSANSIEDVVYVIRMVSFALLLVPIMSMIRGFFQGHESMGPTALSQVVEQIVRIAFLLGGAYVVLHLLDGDIQTAVGMATFAAFVGALAGLAILVWYWIKRRAYLDALLEKDKGTVNLSIKSMYKELLLYAGPFVFVGLALPLYQLVDMFTFNHAMAQIGLTKVSEEAFGMINTYGQKLVIIPVTLATSFALTLIPAITKSYQLDDQQVLQKQISKTLQILLFLTVPACVGLSVLGGPAYAAFFDYRELGGYLLSWFAPVAIPLAVFTVTASILQGINKQKHTVYSLIIGLSLKLSLNYVFILWFNAEGSIIATGIGYSASCAYNLWVIKKYANFDYSFVARRFLLMAIFNMAMLLTVLLTSSLIQGVIPYSEGRMYAILFLLICATVGAGVYLYLSYKSTLLYYLLGDRIRFLRKQKEVS
ncbi:putative polysaccharide biosynthesis protein [Bacillus alkalisoli]|uniref:putative polysaccharide biosynthesis protein n=1 Tax=Bacillus alkalisoli TaxID=2011008 RepID=UPI000C24CC39|nr:polysaccharide biosynthesis protein [Bacillus alkalisoli]